LRLATLQHHFQNSETLRFQWLQQHAFAHLKSLLLGSPHSGKERRVQLIPVRFDAGTWRIEVIFELLFYHWQGDGLEEFSEVSKWSPEKTRLRILVHFKSIVNGCVSHAFEVGGICIDSFIYFMSSLLGVTVKINVNNFLFWS
jgi:hypothetical protein